MSKYSSHTQPRRHSNHQHPTNLPTSSTLPRPSSEDFDRVFLSPAPFRPHSCSTVPRPSPGTASPTLTSKILSTAGQTGSTRDLRLLLQDALSLSEKLDSVSAGAGKGNPEYHTLSSRASLSSLPLSASLSSNGSLFKTGSDDRLNQSGGGDIPPRRNASSSSSSSLTAKKKPPTSPHHNGVRSPPIAAQPAPRYPSPLLQHSSSPDYDIPRSPSQPLIQPPSSQPPSQEKSLQDNVGVGLDCIAQLEMLERDLHSYTPTTYPQRDSNGVSSSAKDNAPDAHYAMAPEYDISKNPVPPSQRVGGRPSVADFVDELTEVEDQVRRSPGQRSSSRERGLTASTATRELDELMANLSKFEPASGKSGDYSHTGPEGQKPKSAMDNLNSMLGSLDEDMTKRHGVNTAPKGVCAACNKPILTKVVNALGQQWHKEHFTCSQCDIELGSCTYYENNGRPYCEKDYHELFAPRCAYCNGPVLEHVLRALDKTWHKEHFFCTLCGKDFGPEGFHEKDGKAFCRECYYEKFAPRCKRCEKAIMEGFITALSSQWHPECFSCKVCGVTFPRGNYFEHEGEPHCEIHYHASRGTLCASCQKPVTGKCITAMGKKWHPEHFTCAFCLKLLNKGTFKEHRHNPYCQACYIKLFG